MKRLHAGSVEAISPAERKVDMDGLEPRWTSVVEALLSGQRLRPLQRAALVEAAVLESREHLVVCSPPNSGKSLVGHLLLLDAVMRGQRAILLEPLRALAEEQAAELRRGLKVLTPSVFSRPPEIRLSTGDYRADGELPAAAPPNGEIIIATPERLDAILRNARYGGWTTSVGAVVVDEAHLLADSKRGPTLELVVASMLSLPAPPRLALLSGTLGKPERLLGWLDPCRLITSSHCTPHHKEVWEVDAADDPDALLLTELSGVLRDPRQSALVFVYRRSDADALAEKFARALRQPVLSYHSGQTMSTRSQTRMSFSGGRCRCVVATTSLAMGVNLPATHVYVRDTTFYGDHRLDVGELLQILGRAGRGERHGLGAVLIRQSDDWASQELASSLRDAAITPIRSSFESVPMRLGRVSNSKSRDLAAATVVASCLSREDTGWTIDELTGLLGHTLGARWLVPLAAHSVQWLSDSARALGFQAADGRHRLTALGLRGVRSMLPLPYTAATGQLIRDLLSTDPSSTLLGRWSELDHLLLLSMLSDNAPKLRRFSEELARDIDEWHACRPDAEQSLLFSRWLSGSERESRADQLWGSISVGGRPHPRDAADARRRAYLSMLAAVLLRERSEGSSVEDVGRRWGVCLDGVDEAWRDTATWMLAGHAAIFELPAFYYHLLEGCAASVEQVRDAKCALRTMRIQAFALLRQLKECPSEACA